MDGVRRTGPHPVPLFIYPLPRSLVERFAIQLRSYLSSRAWDRVYSQIAGGLAVYVYYYRSLPLRVAHFDRSFDGSATFAEREKAFASIWPPPQLSVPLWAKAFSRLLALGYIPGALGSRGTGDCCNPQNAVLDGGFVDLDSVIPISELDSESLLVQTLYYSLRSLTNTCVTLLLGRNTKPRDGKERLGRSVAESTIRDYLVSAVREALAVEQQQGFVIDRRIVRYFAPVQTLTQMANALRTVCEPPFAGKVPK